MKKSVSTHEAKTHLSKIIEEVIAGAEVVICRGKVPVARIVQYKTSNSPPTRPNVGVATSAPVKYSADVFAPLSEREELDSWGMK